MLEVKIQRRTFTDEYKREAASRVINTGRSVAKAARKINVGDPTLGTWVRAERADAGSVGRLWASCEYLRL